MKHCLILTSSFSHENEGASAAGVFVKDFAETLSAQCRVTVVAPAHEDKETVDGNLKTIRFRSRKLPLASLSPMRLQDWLTAAEVMKAARRIVRSVTEDDGIDHALAFWIIPSGLWLPRQTGIATSTWALGSDIWKIGRLPFGSRLLRHVQAQADFHFADGHELAETAERLGGRPCRFLPSSRRLHPSPRSRQTAPPYRLRFLGRWHPNKGVDLLLHALSRLHDDDWTRIASIEIAGGGPLEPVVTRQVAGLRAAGRPVQLRGYLDRAEAAEFLSGADLILLPSCVESVPVIFSDAMQCRRPVLATPVGDLELLVTKYKVGWVSADASPGSYAIAMQNALNAGLDIKEASLARAAADFSIAGAVDRFLAIVDGYNQKQAQE